MTALTLADGARPRVEVLWINPPAQAALSQRKLFCAPAPAQVPA